MKEESDKERSRVMERMMTDERIIKDAGAVDAYRVTVREREQLIWNL